jgi:TetR/AcrR family transcriptional regulator
MGTAERREREKEERRNSILDAAEKVFFSKGVKDATMDEIAEAAELSKGTLYLYFGSKEDIHLGIDLRALKILGGMFEAVLATGRSGIDQVHAMGRAYLEFSRRYPDYFDTMLHFDAETAKLEDIGPLGAECHRAGMGALELVAEAIRAGMRDGSVRNDLDPMKTAILLWAQTDGVIRIVGRKCEHLREFEAIDVDGLIEDFFAFIYGALRPAGKEAGGGAYPGRAGDVGKP